MKTHQIASHDTLPDILIDAAAVDDHDGRYPVRSVDADHFLVTAGELNMSVNQDTNLHTWQGSFLEEIDFTVSEAGGTVTGSLEKEGTGDLTQFWSDEYDTLDCTAPPCTVDLTAFVGTDTDPAEVFVYILQSDKTTLVASNSDWPSASLEHIRVSHLILQSAATTGTEGALGNRNWNDFAFGITNPRGGTMQTNERIRAQHAQWNSGVVLTPTGSGTATITLATSSGTVYQLNLQSFPALDMAGADNIHIANQVANAGTAYETSVNLVTDVTHYDDGANGTAIGNSKFFNLVVWGVQNRTSTTSHLLCNIPTGQYSKSSDATVDAEKFSVFTIPDAFKGTGFLIAELTYQLTGGGSTWTLEKNRDLLGQFPSLVPGGGTTNNITTFPDNVFEIFDDGDDTKRLNFQLSGLGVGNTTVLTVPDASGVIFLASGSQPMSGNLDMAENNIIDCGDIIPNVSAGPTPVQTLGDDNNRWTAGHIENVRVGQSGSFSNPDIVWSDQISLGLYRPSFGTIGITGDVEILGAASSNFTRFFIDQSAGVMTLHRNSATGASSGVLNLRSAKGFIGAESNGKGDNVRIANIQAATWNQSTGGYTTVARFTAVTAEAHDTNSKRGTKIVFEVNPLDSGFAPAIALTLEADKTGTFAGAVTVATTLGVTGISTFTGVINANGGVTLGDGDDLIGSATSDITINTDKFTVAGASGNTVVAGTLNVTGVATLGDGSLLATSAAPTVDAGIANKKYVDDNAGSTGGLTMGIDANDNVWLGDVTTLNDILGTALENIAIGAGAGTAITSGDNNILIGDDAGLGLTTVSDNIVIGSDAMSLITVASGVNVAIGTAALKGTAASSIAWNIAIGHHAGLAADGAMKNIMIGAFVADSITSGDQNVIIGDNAGDVITEGSDNVLIGYISGQNKTTGDNNVLIGSGVGATQFGAAGDSDLLGIDSTDTATPLIAGFFAAHASGPALTINGAVTLGLASTEEINCVGRLTPRDLGQDPTGTVTAGSEGEIGYFSDKWYGKTVGDGTDTNWVALN